MAPLGSAGELPSHHLCVLPPLSLTPSPPLARPWGEAGGVNGVGGWTPEAERPGWRTVDPVGCRGERVSVSLQGQRVCVLTAPTERGDVLCADGGALK